MNLKKFLQELKRRNVFKVATAYAIAGWLIIQVATSVFPAFKFPDWTTQFVIILVLIGFPISIILAWAFEMTQEGVKRTDEESEEQPTTKKTGRKLDIILGLLLVLAVGIIFYQQVSKPKRGTTQELSAGPASVDSLSAPSKSIAVLPFVNMSADTNNAYFASGIRDLILTKLDEIGGLKVIARTTSDQYKSRPEDLRTVGSQLGVATVLEGSVQKAGNQVLINVQLIKTTTSGHLWAHDYIRTLTNIFGVEGEVADSIAQSLHTTLTPEEANTVHQIATRNPQAYDLYLKANYIERTLVTSGASPSDLNKAIDLCQKAIDLDSTFTLAYARKATLLAEENLVSAYNKNRYERAYNAAQKALKLNPDLPEAYVAMGVVYLFGSHDYHSALRYLKQAYAKMPNNAGVLEAVSEAMKYLGQWDQAKTELERATILDPHNSLYLDRLGEVYAHLRLYNKAEDAFQQGLSVNPQDNILKIFYYIPTLMMEGKLDSAGGMLMRMARRLKERKLSLLWSNRVYARLGYVYTYERNFDKARLAFSTLKPTPNTNLGGLVSSGFIVDPSINLVRLDLERGARNQARLQARIARDSLNHYWGQYVDRQDYSGADYYVGLAWVKAGLGDKQGAVRAAQKAIQIMPVSRDALYGPWYVEALAEIYTQTGYSDQAIATLKQLMEMQAGGMACSPTELRQDPVWDPLRKEPAFQSLLKKYP
ncbi:MAG TPA: tetratricopeptide repeat protein [Balneolales bacterium]|nr:tetratricopeptide repeat protein [Balneolales bacterium]